MGDEVTISERSVTSTRAVFSGRACHLIMTAMMPTPYRPNGEGIQFGALGFIGIRLPGGPFIKGRAGRRQCPPAIPLAHRIMSQTEGFMFMVKNAEEPGAPCSPIVQTLQDINPHTKVATRQAIRPRFEHLRGPLSSPCVWYMSLYLAGSILIFLYHKMKRESV